MKLAISTNLFKNFPLNEALKTIKSIGYEGVELLTDVPHFYPPQTTITKIYDTLELLNRLKLNVSNVNAFMFFAVGNSHYPSYFDDRGLRIDFTKWSIFTAGILKSQTISIEPAGKSKTTFENDLQSFVKILEELEPIAKNSNTKILIEPEPGLLIENVEQSLKFISILKHSSRSYRLKLSSLEHFGINADLGHFYCVGENYEKVFTNLKNYIFHIHIEDINKDREHFHLVPGDGVIDFSEILFWLKKINYQSWITVELYPFQDNPIQCAERAFIYLKKIGF